MDVPILCDSAELAVECLHAGQRLGLGIAPETTDALLPAARARLAQQPTLALGFSTPPSLAELVELSDLKQRHGAGLLLLMLGPARSTLHDVAADLGLPAVHDVDPLLSLLALSQLDAAKAWQASTRALSTIDRARLRGSVNPSTDTKGGRLRLRPADGGLLELEASDGRAQPIGRARDVAHALQALRETVPAPQRISASVEGADEAAVLDVLFGPRRALSDPASKAALGPYGLPMPDEELCASPSRAAAEASRMGFPVRISLASPDLRIWDHPELAVDMVTTAAAVRDTFRQLMSAAQAQRQEGQTTAPRLLGVMVTATSEPTALLGVRVQALTGKRVALELGFSDPHGAAAGDRTQAVLPAPQAAIERIVCRLRGHALLLDGPPSLRARRLETLTDVLLRLSAFVVDREAEVESVELRPIAVLADGSTEIREACVRVSDAFERTLQANVTP